MPRHSSFGSSMAMISYDMQWSPPTSITYTWSGLSPTAAEALQYSMKACSTVSYRWRYGGASLSGTSSVEPPWRTRK